MAAASGVMGVVDMDWELCIMRETKPVQPISLRSKIFSVASADKGRDCVFIVSQLFLSSKNARQGHETSHSPCFLHSG